MKPVPGTARAWRWVRAHLQCRAMPSEGIQGDERGAYLALARMTGTNAGSPAGRESHGDRGPVVVAGVTPRQGGRESRPQGEGGQAVEDDRMPGGMRNAESRNGDGNPACTRQAEASRELHVKIAGEPDALKGASPVRTGGRRKRT